MSATRQALDGSSWTTDAACRDDTGIDFTDPGPDAAEALATCARCAVRDACLDTALSLDADSDLGIWGGTTAQTRTAIRSGRLDRTDGAHRNLAAHLASHNGQPLTTVRRDRHGDWADPTGRVIITRLPVPGPEPYLVLLDGTPTHRAQTLTGARAAAHTALHQQPRRPPVAPNRRGERLLDGAPDRDGDWVDPTGRVVITQLPVPGPEPYLVFVDGTPTDRAETLNGARIRGHHRLTAAPPAAAAAVAVAATRQPGRTAPNTPGRVRRR